MSLSLIFLSLLAGCCGNVDSEPYVERVGFTQEELDALFGDGGHTGHTGGTDTAATSVDPASVGCEDACSAYEPSDAFLSCKTAALEEGEALAVECEFLDQCVGGRLHEVVQTTTRGAGPDAVAAHLAQMAHDEWASVFAFLALADELRAHGAPSPLVARVLEAAADEVRHARMIAGLARARGGVVPRPEIGRPRARSLEEIARENVVEAVVVETWSALRAAHQALRAADPELRQAFRTIARDETRHAELALDLDRWLRSRLDDASNRRLDAARGDAVARLVVAARRRDVPEPARSALGLPSALEAEALTRGLADALWS